jgi:DNA-directed RNA polymerase sigma subunit (sigma70/sigma32)
VTPLSARQMHALEDRPTWKTLQKIELLRANGWTLKAIGKAVGLSTERVRQKHYTMMRYRETQRLAFAGTPLQCAIEMKLLPILKEYV